MDNIKNSHNHKYVDAVIISIKKYGFFVTFKLDDKVQYGFVHISECENDYLKSNKVINKMEKGITVKLDIMEYQQDKGRYLLSFKKVHKDHRCNNYLLSNNNGFNRLKKVTEKKIEEFILK